MRRAWGNGFGGSQLRAVAAEAASDLRAGHRASEGLFQEGARGLLLPGGKVPVFDLAVPVEPSIHEAAILGLSEVAMGVVSGAELPLQRGRRLAPAGPQYQLVSPAGSALHRVFGSGEGIPNSRTV